jgi:glycosyltransferase involved in cell wall biosynthesis
MPLNVLHISDSDVGGGAARTAYSIHRRLRALGHDSRMLVGRPLSGDADVRSIKRNAGWRAADRTAASLLDRLSLQYVFYPSSFAVPRDPWFRRADVVQLYNLHGSYFSFTALPALTRSRPVFWVLQDQWAMTGHVSYSFDCDRWRHGCGECPYLGVYPALRRDTTAVLWRLKRAAYRRSRLALVVPSRWLEHLARESPLLRDFPIHRIPHGVDTKLFAPGSQDEARRRLGLPLDRRIVFFSAWDLHERRKGLELLLEARRQLDPKPLLLLAGRGSPPNDGDVAALGHVEDDSVLADAYRAADVYAVPTVADVLTKTAPEAIATGTPCVAFDRGGVTDVVRHDETGYQARFGDVRDLRHALEVLLRDDALRARLGRRGRELAEREFSTEVQVDRYLALYEAASPA